MTIAAATPVELAGKTDALRTRSVGGLAIASGIASLVLLASHPGGAAHGFAEVLRNEAANRLVDGIVHGGFIAVLGLQLVCYSIFSARLGLTRATTVAGLVFFGMGVAFLCGSMVIDGLVNPAIAARYLSAPEKLEFARSLFVLMGTLVALLMPVGLIFQSMAFVAWGWALIATGHSRIVGFAGISLGSLMGAALALEFSQLNPFVLMGAIVGTSVWALAVGAMLIRQS